MKKIVLIVMIMVFVLGLMGSGIIPIGKKKPKGKKKQKANIDVGLFEYFSIARITF